MADPETLLRSLRGLLELASKAKTGARRPWLALFPMGGCCYNVVTLAARFLHEQHQVAKNRILGAFNASHPVSGHHSWLLVDGLIYDLTADQFAGVNSPIFGFERSEFHEMKCGVPEIWDYDQTASMQPDWEKENLIPVLDWIRQQSG